MGVVLRRTRTLEPGAWTEGWARPRILVEDPDGAVRAASRRILEREGFEVATCSGPEPGHRCPEVTRTACPLMRGVDLIYSSLDWHRPEHREVLQAQREHHPDVPVVVEIAQPQAQRAAELLQGCTVVYMPVSGAMMVETVQRALSASTAAS